MKFYSFYLMFCGYKGFFLNLQEWKGSLRHARSWAGCGCESLGRWNTSCSGPERSHPYDPGPAAKSWLDAAPGRSFSPQRFSHQVMLWSCGGDYMKQTPPILVGQSSDTANSHLSMNKQLSADSAEVVLDTFRHKLCIKMLCKLLNIS